MQPRENGTVRFDSDPRMANIIIDGQILVNPDTEEGIKTPAAVKIIEGRRDFILRLQGYDDEVGYVDVIANRTVNIYRRLNPGKTTVLRSTGDIFRMR